MVNKSYLEVTDWLLVLAASLAEGEGPCDMFSSLHTTEGILHFPSLTTRKKTVHTAETV